MCYVKDVNEPIIDRGTFEKVQTLFVSSRHKPIKAGESNMFSGILKCADCGGNLLARKSCIKNECS